MIVDGHVQIFSACPARALHAESNGPNTLRTTELLFQRERVRRFPPELLRTMLRKLGLVETDTVDTRTLHTRGRRRNFVQP